VDWFKLKLIFLKGAVRGFFSRFGGRPDDLSAEMTECDSSDEEPEESLVEHTGLLATTLHALEI